MNENSGGDVGYYVVQIDHPKRFKPCVVECEDIIAALGMDFFEGEAFKAVWRKAAQRTLGVGKAGNSALRDAQKMAHYGARCLALEEQRGMPKGEQLVQAPSAPKFDPTDPGQWRVGDELLGNSGSLYTLRQPVNGKYAEVTSPYGVADQVLAACVAWQSRPEAEPVPLVNRTGNPQLWLPGDAIRYIGESGNLFVTGDVKEVKEVRGSQLLIEAGTDIEHTLSFGFAAENFEWLERP